MVKNVFLVPCDSPNFDRTVRSPVDLGGSPDHPSLLDGADEVRFWGVRDGSQNQNYFEKMESDDLVIFYQDGNYIGTGWIGETFEDEDQWASATFWQNAPINMIFTINEFHTLKIPKATVNGLFDYVPDYNPEGLIRVADNRLNYTPKAIEQALIRYHKKYA